MSGRFDISYAGSFRFPVAPEELWTLVEDPGHFEQWWGWLHEVECSDPRIVSGSVLTGVIDPPVPFAMWTQVVIDEYERLRHITASVTGDIKGAAHLDTSAAAGGTQVEIGWDVEMMQRRMRMAALVARPLLQWGHDRVVEAAVRGFSRRLEQ